MCRILLSAAVAVVSLGLAVPAEAGPKGGSGGHPRGGDHTRSGHPQGSDHTPRNGHPQGGYGNGHPQGGNHTPRNGHPQGGNHTRNGHPQGGNHTRNGSHRGSHALRGRTGHRWGKTRFDKRYGCNLYCEGGTNCWYYWCPPDDCYYPVEECPYGTYTWDDDSGGCGGDCGSGGGCGGDCGSGSGCSGGCGCGCGCSGGCGCGCRN